jgi:hypothetical protein
MLVIYWRDRTFDETKCAIRPRPLREYYNGNISTILVSFEEYDEEV